MKTFRLDIYELTCVDVRTIEFGSSPGHHGVAIFEGCFKYEVLVSPYFGVRLLITRTDLEGHIQDMPFHHGTAHFLPKSVVVTTVK